MKSNLIIKDAALMDSLRIGDKEAFDFIYHRYANDLYQYARKNLSSSEECKEIVQDVFAYLWDKHEVLRVENFWGYLLQAVRTRIVEKFREDSVHENYAWHYRTFEMVYEPNEYNSDSAMDTAALHELIQRSLPALPEKCQEAFRMRLSLNLSNAEIAERMNIKKGMVERYMSTALTHLRASYKQIYRVTGFTLPLFLSLVNI